MVIHHSAVSLDYLEERLKEGKSAGIHQNSAGYLRWLPLSSQKRQVKSWRKKGYAYAPPCDNVQSDGRCAGHDVL